MRKIPDPEAFSLCNQKSVSEIERKNYEEFHNAVNQEPDEVIVDLDEVQFARFIYEKFKLPIPQLHFDRIEFTREKVSVAGGHHPLYRFDVREKNYYEREAIIFHIPCDGNIEMLRYRSNEISYNYTPSVFIEDGALCFLLVNFFNELENLTAQKENIVGEIQGVTTLTFQSFERLNTNLWHSILSAVRERKIRTKQIGSVFGIPIKKRRDLPENLLPPAAAKKIIALKPQPLDAAGKAEFEIEEEIYQDILQTIHAFGASLEKAPAAIKNLEEEQLRDHFLFVLAPHYDWQAVGEAFNKNGKTDILINYKNITAFVAECKFWYGPKGYLDTISQLFDRYLLWRNSKAAVVIFVRNKNFSKVIEEIKNTTHEHPNYLRFADEKSGTWLNYVFHITNNPEREVKLAVLLFHLPSVEMTTE